MNSAVAVGVKEHTVGRSILAASGSPDNVVAVPSGEFGNLLLAVWTDPMLLFPQMQKYSSFAEIAFHLEIESFLEVGFPGWIVRVGLFLDFDMPLDRRICDPGEVDARGFLLMCDFSEEDPISLSDGAEILLLHPVGTFVGVPSSRPVPEGLKDGALDPIESRFADHMPVISGPSSNDSIELTDQMPGSGWLILADDPSHFVKECLHILL